MDLEENMSLIHFKSSRERLTYIQGVKFSVTDITTIRYFSYSCKVSTKVFVTTNTKDLENV